MSKGPGGEYILPPLTWRASPNYSRRLYHSKPTQIYLHDTEGHYPGDIATLCNPATQSSAHIVLREDGDDATQLVAFSQKAWTETVGNDAGLSIEMSGVKVTHSMWSGLTLIRKRQYIDQWHTAARIAAFWCDTYGIPAHWSVKHGGPYSPGLMRHVDLLGLGQPPSTHTDPTDVVSGTGQANANPSPPSWLWWVALVQHELDRGGFLAHWGKS